MEAGGWVGFGVACQQSVRLDCGHSQPILLLLTGLTGKAFTNIDTSVNMSQ